MVAEQMVRSVAAESEFRQRVSLPSKAALRVLLFDPLAIVPYYTAYLSRALLNEGVAVTVASITYYLDPACFTSRGVKLQPGVMNVVGRFSLPPTPRRVLKLLELTLNLAAQMARTLLRPSEVVHVQYLPLLRWRLPLDLWFVRVARRRGSKFVLTVHDLLPHDTADRYRTIYQRLYRYADALICHSDHVKTCLQAVFGIEERRISVIPHGPFFYDLPTTPRGDLRSKLRIPEGRRIVLWQGILFPYKGLDLLLEAWQTVERQCPAAHLVVVGTGAPELLAAVREQVQRLNLQHVTLDLRFASTEELVAMYRAADVVVYPYRAITTSGALATGLALGKAIVASDLPVFREMLRDGENALLTPVGDIEELASAMLRLLLDDGLRQRLVETVVAMHFGEQSWASIAERTTAVYRSALGEEAAGVP